MMNHLNHGMNRMQQHTQHIITQVGASLSTGSGIWMWLGENHDQIAAIGILFGMAVGLIGLGLQVYKLRR